jgi:hypothetical protein
MREFVREPWTSVMNSRQVNAASQLWLSVFVGCVDGYEGDERIVLDAGYLR